MVQNMAKIWSKYGQNMAKYGPKYGPKYGQNMVQNMGMLRELRV